MSYVFTCIIHCYPYFTNSFRFSQRFRSTAPTGTSACTFGQALGCLQRHLSSKASQLQGLRQLRLSMENASPRSLWSLWKNF